MGGSSSSDDVPPPGSREDASEETGLSPVRGVGNNGRMTTRPAFHFTARHGWINDPHAVSVHGDCYHVFFQFVPGGHEWAPECCWGHATATDLVTFTEKPVALAPGDGDDGVWTGSIITPDDGPSTLFYTSVVLSDLRIGGVRVAHPRGDDWSAWEKGPVVAEAPGSLGVSAFRDPFVLRDEGAGRWRMLVGAALPDDTAAALSFSSPDLDTWRYDGLAASRSATHTHRVWTGSLWECPQLFELDGRFALVVSVWHDDTLHHVAYAIGDYRDGVFIPTVWDRLSYGPSYYAPTFFRDVDGRPTLLFWLRGVEDRAAGWVGAHSLAHTLSLNGDRLVAKPHADLERYRTPLGAGVSALGTAVDVVWTPAEVDRLVLSGRCGEICSVERRNEEITLRRGSDLWAMPYDGGPVRFVVDGPLVEISSGTGLLAAPLTSDDELQVAAVGAVEAWNLTREPA